jgi:hypothetical protein
MNHVYINHAHVSTMFSHVHQYIRLQYLFSYHLRNILCIYLVRFVHKQSQIYSYHSFLIMYTILTFFTEVVNPE